MAKVKAEFINICSCCAEKGRMIQEVAERYGDEVDVTLLCGGQRLFWAVPWGPSRTAEP